MVLFGLSILVIVNEIGYYHTYGCLYAGRSGFFVACSPVLGVILLVLGVTVTAGLGVLCALKSVRHLSHR